MGITTYLFVLVFLPITIIGWKILLNIRYKNYMLSLFFLIVTSLYFIGSYDYRFIITITLTALINYYGVKFISNIKSHLIKKSITMCLVFANVSVLILLKYTNWIRELFGAIDQPWNLVLPIGISFYTLEQIMYIVDSYNHDAYLYSFIEYLSYSTFFPVIISGPVFHHSQYVEQLRTIHKKGISDEKIRQGIISFSFGLGKKVLVASQLGHFVDFGYGNIETMSTWAVIACITSYSLQLYFDFSGYCNIVEGIGLMMGFELPVNFSSPYKSASIGEFWDKWHITLTKFFTKYVYIPLGGNRKGALRQAVNILLVFLLSGLWHGTSLTFVLWGGLHGAFMIIDKYLETYWNRIWLFLRKGTTFVLVSILWIPFRAESLTNVVRIFKGLENLRVATKEELYHTMFPMLFSIIKEIGVKGDIVFIWQKVLTITSIIILLVIVFQGKNVKFLREKYCTKTWMALLCGIILSLSIMQFSTGAPDFIYEGF